MNSARLLACFKLTHPYALGWIGLTEAALQPHLAREKSPWASRGLCLACPFASSQTVAKRLHQHSHCLARLKRRKKSFSGFSISSQRSFSNQTGKVRGRQFCTQCCRDQTSLPRISTLWTAINPLRDMLKNKAIPKINNSDFKLYDRQLLCLNNWV